jgi:putative hydrolase of the HAD superfamily
LALGGVIRADTGAVLLDGLGTLVALEPPWPRLVEWLDREHGVHLALADAERAFRAEMIYYRAHHQEGRDVRSVAELRRRCAEVLGEALPAGAAGLSIDQLTEAMLGALRFSAYPDALVTLPALRDRGLRLVAVSNWDSTLPSVLRATGLEGALDGVLTSAEVGQPKPRREIFDAALALAGVDPQRAVHVGDSLAHDVEGALAVGVAPVLLDRGGGDPGQAPVGVPVIASLTELPGLLGAQAR